MEETNDRCNNLAGCSRSRCLVCDLNVQFTDSIKEQGKERLVPDRCSVKEKTRPYSEPARDRKRLYEARAGNNGEHYKVPQSGNGCRNCW